MIRLGLSKYVLVLVSEHYITKDWPDFEFSVAEAEEKARNTTHIIPLRLDDT